MRAPSTEMILQPESALSWAPERQQEPKLGAAVNTNKIVAARVGNTWKKKEAERGQQTTLPWAVWEGLAKAWELLSAFLFFSCFFSVRLGCKVPALLQQETYYIINSAKTPHEIKRNQVHPHFPYFHFLPRMRVVI